MFPLERNNSLFAYWLMAVLFGALLILLPQRDALADSTAPPRTCNDNPAHYYNVEGYDNDNFADDQRGIRSDMFAAAEHFCSRVSSLSIFGPNNTASDPEFVEWGWLTGYNSGNTDYYHAPTPFFAWSDDGDGATIHYRIFPGLNIGAGVYRHFRLSDINGNTVYGGYIDADEKMVVNTTFSQGVGLTNGERDNPTDSAYSSFKDLDEYHDGNGWSNWDNVARFADTDPNFDFQRLAPNWNRVAQ